MSRNWSEADLAEYRQRQQLRKVAPPKAGAATAQTKYRNQVTLGPDPCGGVRRYSSKREARRAQALDQMKRAGEIADFFPQASIAYGVDENDNALRYVADFLVIKEYRPDGTFVGWMEDPKGARTERSTAKMGALRARGLQVRVI